MLDARNGQSALGVHRRHAAEARARHGAAVVGVLSADDGVPPGLAHEVPVASHHAHHGVVGLGSRIGEKDVIQMLRRNLGQQLGKLHRGRVGGLEKIVVERQLLELAAAGLDELFSAVAQVDAPKPGHAVQDLVALRVPHVHPLGAGDDAAAFLGQGLVIGKRMQVMRGIQALPLGGGPVVCPLCHENLFPEK